MPKGKAYGVDREYQKLCHDIIQTLQREKQLHSYNGDGVDVTFPVAGTKVTFDAVLKHNTGSLVVIESKRYASKQIEQRDVFAFWGEITLLQVSLGVDVKGIFITKSNYREGAIKAAATLGIDIAACEQDQTPNRFVISFFEHNPILSGRRNGVVKHVIARI